jgi:flagellar FliJ protein
MARGFPLAGLLRLRQIQQEHAASDLAAANAAARSSAARRSAARAQLAGVAATSSAAADLLAVAAARASTRSMLTELDAADDDAQRAAAEAGEEYTRAKTRASGLEKLEQRHLQAQSAEELRQEQETIDEFAARAKRSAP